jgi:hypothetical protein
MARIERQLGALTEREQPARQGRLAIDPDQRFGPDQLAGRTEERMTALHGTHLDAPDPVDRPAEKRRIDMLDA